ncbi:MAG: hypothetical protein E6767_04990 [Dysgonomonas sp.]|nr:hypothetical protein [Dysgonomonas sp.]
MKNLISFILSAFCICLISCDSEMEEGKLTKIGLETKQIQVGSESYKSIITTKNAGWSVRGGKIIITGDTINFENETYLYSDDTHIDVAALKDTIIGDWYKIIKKEPKQLQVEMLENNTANNRTLVIDLDGLWMISESLEIHQAKK